MTYPVQSREPALHMVSSFGPWASQLMSSGVAGGPTSQTWEAANRTIYVPIYVPVPCVLQRLWWANGSTTTGGATVTAALYSDSNRQPSTRLVTANATQGTASEVQFVSPSAYTITQPGRYWLALASTSATNTTFQAANVIYTVQGHSKRQEATGTPPATATPTDPASGLHYLFGFSTVTTP